MVQRPYMCMLFAILTLLCCDGRLLRLFFALFVPLIIYEHHDLSSRYSFSHDRLPYSYLSSGSPTHSVSFNIYLVLGLISNCIYNTHLTALRSSTQ
jgi:hypothetical protein